MTKCTFYTIVKKGSSYKLGKYLYIRRKTSRETGLFLYKSDFDTYPLFIHFLWISCV